MYNIENDDLRWYENADPKNKNRVSYLDTLRAMCRYYGTFCGRWHDNEFWHKTLRLSYSLTEKDAKKKVFEIENEAEADLEYWRTTQ